jgi:hypothetical protein
MLSTTPFDMLTIAIDMNTAITSVSIHRVRCLPALPSRAFFFRKVRNMLLATRLRWRVSRILVISQIARAAVGWLLIARSRRRLRW